MTNTEEAALLDHYNNVAQLGQEIVSWFGLATNTTTPDTEAGTGITEPTNGSWARVEVILEDFWSDAFINDDGHAQAENVKALEFTDYDGGGATITHVVEWNDETGTDATNVRRIWALDSAITPVAGQTLRFHPCAITASIERNKGGIDNTLQDVVES